MKYECQYCNYETHDFGNFSRHKQSKKHANNMIKSQSTINNCQSQNNHLSIDCQPDKSVVVTQQKNKVGSDNILKKKYICRHCDSIFSYRQSLNKHEKYRCKIRKEYERKNEELEKKNKTLEKQNERLMNMAENNSESVKKSISTLSYAIKYLGNSPPIELLEGKKLNKFITYDGNTDRCIEEIIIHHFEKKKLHQLLGDLIINTYTKEDPSEQSMFSSDVARLTFIIKQVVQNDVSKWIVDKSGLSIIKLIINPLTKKTKELIQAYVNKCGKYINTPGKLNNEDELIIKQKLRNMEKANSVIMMINLKKTNTEILKYIAPHFNLNDKVLKT